jgi:uncharacterized membrane protein
VRSAGWIVVAVVAAALVLPGASTAFAGSAASQHQAAVDVYAEEFPTAVGAVPADVTGIPAGTSRIAGAGRSDGGGLLGLGLVLAGVTAVIVVAGLRQERRRS